MDPDSPWEENPETHHAPEAEWTKITSEFTNVGIHRFTPHSCFIPYHPSLGTERASLQAKKPFYSQALTLASPTWACLSVESLVASVGWLLRFCLSCALRVQIRSSSRKSVAYRLFSRPYSSPISHPAISKPNNMPRSTLPSTIQRSSKTQTRRQRRYRRRDAR